MRSLFDYQSFEFQFIGGALRSYAELISQINVYGIDPIVSIKESGNVYLKNARFSKGIKLFYHTHNVLFEGKKRFKGQRGLTRKLGRYCDCTQMNKEYCIKLLKQE